MTALSKYDRLEASALWRPDSDAQRREVIVSIGNSTLVISALNDTALTHWSLAAIERANPGETPAIYHPDGDPGETLEIAENHGEMIDAVEKLRRAVARTRPKPGRLRWMGGAGMLAAVLALVLFWLPGAVRDHALSVVPQAKRDQIGEALLARLERISGSPCDDPAGVKALQTLSARLRAGELMVMPAMTQPSVFLPGGYIVLSRALIEDYEEPDVAAGFVLAEASRRAQTDPLGDLLTFGGLRETLRLLTTGDVSAAALDGYAEALMALPRPPAPLQPLLARFEKAALRSAPYAYALDITGETTLPLIEGDPMNGKATEPLISDGDWLRLQGLCGG
ncbi:MAG: hypothetical protein ACSHWZ_02940 [Sulfitobacter sp.]